MNFSTKNKPVLKASGSFLCFASLYALLIILAIVLFFLKTHEAPHFQPNIIIAANFLVFLFIWATGIAIIPALPDYFHKKGIFFLITPGVVIHGISISGRVIEGHDILPAFLVFALDVGITALLLEILKIKSLNPKWAFLYIVNPCVIAGLFICPPSTFAGILFFIIAIYFYLLKRWKMMFAFSGLQAALFPYSIPATLLLLNKQNIQKAWMFLPGFAASLLVSFLFSHSSIFSLNDLDTEAIIKTGALNHFLQFVFHVQNVDIISYVPAFLVMASGILIFHPALNPRYENGPFHGIFLVLATMTVFMPEVPVSIFICIAAFIVFRPSIMWLMLGFSAFPYAAVSGLSASSYGISPEFQIFCGNTHLTSIIWFPLYISFPFAFYRMIQHHRKYRQTAWTKKIKTLSVIIPVLNEECGIGQCIKSIRTDSSVTEIIVIDGGSHDNTVDVAKNEGAEVLIHKKPFADGGGRGGQIKAGLMAASGDVIAIVHADSIITSKIFTHIIETLNNNHDVIGGAVGSRFDSDESRFRAIEFANNARMAYLGIAFGDQIQFFRRKPVVENNDFPDIPLMEDVELSMRLKNIGGQVFLFGDVIVSTRRWQKKGFKNALWVIRQVLKYLWTRIWTEPDSISLYKEYYQVKNMENRSV